jgi:hypothetical protein
MKYPGSLIWNSRRYLVTSFAAHSSLEKSRRYIVCEERKNYKSGCNEENRLEIQEPHFTVQETWRWKAKVRASVDAESANAQYEDAILGFLEVSSAMKRGYRSRTRR